MSPVVNDINQNALVPFSESRISMEEAIDRAEVSLRIICLSIQDKDLACLPVSRVNRLKN